jgi:TolA-binding protein
MKKLITVVAGLIAVVLATPLYAGGNKPIYPGANGVPFRALQKQVDGLVASQQSVEELYARITALEGEINDLQSRIDANMGDISNLQQQLSNDEEEIQMLQANLAVMQNSLNDGCPSGMSLLRVMSDGTVLCESNTQSSGGGGNLVVTMRSATVTVSGSPSFPMSATVTAVCPTGQQAVSGGFDVNSMMGVTVVRSMKFDTNAWTVTAVSQTSQVVPVTAYVNCID